MFSIFLRRALRLQEKHSLEVDLTLLKPCCYFMQNGNPGVSKSGSGRQLEEIYKKISHSEHIGFRADTYIGTVVHTKELMWVFNKEENKMIKKELTFVPGLYKIYDEILVNAADNKQRDKSMSCIKIDIDSKNNVISIWNNGQGIPVVMHKDENMYIPTLMFSELLTSSNYNGEEERVTGGRNGLGAKLCNLYSTSFTVETASNEYRKSFRQSWTFHMNEATEPEIKDFDGDDFTKVTFSPDLAKFEMERLDDDIVALMSRRAYDVAASTRGVAVYLNGSKMPVENFKDYVDLYLKGSMDDEQLEPVYEIVNERWEVAVAPSDHGLQQVSFVNSIATTKGGQHVDHVVDNIVKQLIDVLKKKTKGRTKIKPSQVRNHLWVFINCLIVNPTFDSQRKEEMTLLAKYFGSKSDLSEKFIQGVSKCGIVECVLSSSKFKAQNDLAKKTSGKKIEKIKGVPKLEDAKHAGSSKADQCTLILTEGDSAKTLAVSGFGGIGRDHYGVFPLRGKLLNVREATHKQILENAEINNLIKILGLQYKKKYLTIDDMKSLRYGKVMMMADQDHDGSHIKGLIINFIHTNWPELLRLPFLEEFITPIAKANNGLEELSFYSIPEYEEWKNSTPNSHTYNIKYYKGLGTSTSKEAKEYFQNMEKHRILFKHEGSQDDDSIVMAFAKKAVDQRKDWLTRHMEETKHRKLQGLPERYLYANNINLLEPRGQFGTRQDGGKDSASPRYIFTLLSPFARLIFHPHDDPLLNYEVDDDQKIEPTWYIPIIPMVLVNGAEGIGTGWSTKIPNHNPRDIIKNLRLMISKEEPVRVDPWYKNFKGSIKYISEHRYICNGIVSIIGDNKIEITELPEERWR